MGRQRIVWLLRIAFAVLAIGIAAASVSNVVLDNTEVRDLARGVACAQASCVGEGAVGMVRMERSPIGQTFAFQTKTHTVVTARCTRSLLLVGAYSCVRE